MRITASSPAPSEAARIRPAASGLCVVLLGCQALGTATLSAGRGSYNEVIARTNAEQTLGLIVRLRYLDPIGLLTVANVTANLRFTEAAKSDVGFGPPSNYQGALVPFSAGVEYEDNPTISYTPIEGQGSGWLRSHSRR